MSSGINPKDLTVEQRLALLEEIWDSLTPDDVPVTDAQRKELDRRLGAHEENPGEYISWEELRQRMVGKPR